MSEDCYVTVAHAARLVGRTPETVRLWAASRQLGRVRQSRYGRLVRIGAVLERVAMKQEPQRRKRREREPTVQEVERTVAEQSETLPAWWWRDCEMQNGAEFAAVLRARYEAKRRAA